MPPPACERQGMICSAATTLSESGRRRDLKNLERRISMVAIVGVEIAHIQAHDFAEAETSTVGQHQHHVKCLGPQR